MNEVIFNIKLLLIWLVPVIIVFGGLEIFFASRKNKWIGIIIPIVSCILAITLVVGMLDYIKTSVGETKTSYNTDQYSVSFYLIFKDNYNNTYNKNEKVKAFSTAKIKDKDIGKVYYRSIKFDSHGDLVNSKKLSKYAKGLESCAATYSDIKGKTSKTYSEMRSLYKEKHGNSYVKICLISVIFFIPFLISILIYILFRRKNEIKNAKKDFEKMDIEDLE